MRKLADFNDPTTAKFLGDFLLSQGIGNQVDQEDEQPLWVVWVHDDDHLDQARMQLEFFRANPTHPSIRQAAHHASEIRSEQERERKEFRAKPVDIRTQWHTQAMLSGKLTQMLIGLCVLVWAVESFIPHAFRFTHYLYISDLNPNLTLASLLWALLRGQISWNAAMQSGNYWLPEVLHGQIWRLFTPAILHAPLFAGGHQFQIMGILHIFFNMSWLAYLGPMIEKRQGPWRLLWKVLVLALVSNLGQYVFAGPEFYGFSGVICGLAGYIWIRGRYDPDPEMYLDRNTVSTFITWLVIGFLGILPIANGAHAFGLLAGMLWGYGASGRLRWKLKRLTRR